MALQLGRISISNRADGRAVIDIEGIIGIPEWWQFEHPDERVSTYDTFKKRIDEIRNLSVPTVEVNIRSLGGNVNDALLIHDTLCALSAAGIEVITARIHELELKLMSYEMRLCNRRGCADREPQMGF